MNPTDLLQKAADGIRLTPAEGLELYQHADPNRLMEIAHDLRLRKTEPGVVTYLVDRNINYTNACTTDCQFCSFYRVPGHPEVYVQSKRQIGERVEELLAWGGTRILMQGGHNPDLRIEWYEDMLRFLKSTYPEIELDCFSPSEIENIAGLEGLSMEQVLARLNRAGLDGLPGGGAEILDDAVRARIAPKKTKTAAWLHAMRIAQRLGMVTSATMVIGFDETWEQRVASLTRLRELQDESLAAHGNGFTAFIMWTAQLSHTNSLGRSRHRANYGADYDEYLHTNAFARIYLDNFTNFQASWPTQGLDTARRALFAGANDFGSTMLEENVVSQASAFTEQEPRMSVHRLHEQIRQAGFTPAQRDSRYNTVRRFDRVMTAAELAPVSIPTRLNGVEEPAANFLPMASL
ncbi:MAG: CofH family radical SAM protein [Caldilineales bacterium]|nr:CofH family radical SAM protein [Caldilineales bacterium]